METMRISSRDLREILKHARAVYPNEACGLLGGSDLTVRRVFSMRNINPSPVSYEFDSAEQLNVMRRIEKTGFRIVGIFHSHPQSPAVPSATDVRQAYFPGTTEPNYPGVAYLIVGMTRENPEVRAYTIGPKGPHEIPVEVFS